MHKHLAGIVLSLSGLAALAPALAATPAFNVRDFGAAGDGKTLDTGAINKTIEAASAAGGGTVLFPAGTYASYSIHLKSNVALQLDQGSTILAADPPAEGQPGGYDAAEPNPVNDRYQDFGHSHWHNSLIWGENLENISIVGPGRIVGDGLSRGFGRKDGAPGNAPKWPVGHKVLSPVTGKLVYVDPPDILPDGVGNKTIALKNCRNIIFRDFTIYHAGHFGILAIAADNFTVDNLKIDTNRDGMDIDCCHNVHISNCTVNSPHDDGICLKSSFGLGYPRACENVTITGCEVSGFIEGTMLDGTRKVSPKGGGIGRIKFGTESNGGFKNIAISNCVFESCRGLSLETVDGALLEDVVVSNIVMRDIGSAPIFLRLGARLRGPAKSTQVGALRRVTISAVIAHDVNPAGGILILGLPGQAIEDVSLNHILIEYRGGGTKEQAARDVPEDETGYPEASRFGTLPSYGVFARHVRGLTVDHVELRYAGEEHRPAVILDDVANADFDHLKAAHADDAPTFVLKNVKGFLVRNSPGLPDARRDSPVVDETF